MFNFHIHMAEDTNDLLYSIQSRSQRLVRLAKSHDEIQLRINEKQSINPYMKRYI